MEEDSLYEETAENRARNKVILWWMLHLAHAEQEGKDVEFFGSGDLEGKLKIYDEIDEGEDIFEMRGINKEEGCVVIVRPDQHVSKIFSLESVDSIRSFFEAFMVIPKV